MGKKLELTPKEEILQEIKQLRRALEFVRMIVFFMVLAIAVLIGFVVFIVQLIM